eukprot:scaffold50937_cov37-Phaeocystis_antarctica.AAC.1
MRQTSDRRQACGANHYGGGGLGQPPAPRSASMAWRYAPIYLSIYVSILAPAASLEPSSIFSARACTTRAIQSLDWEMTDRQAQI